MVAAGGYTKLHRKIPDVQMADVLNLETMTWSRAPPLHGFNHFSEQVQLEDTFLVVGGFNSFDFYQLKKKVLEFDHQRMEWKEREEQLKWPRNYHSVIQIPRELMIWNNTWL